MPTLEAHTVLDGNGRPPAIAMPRRRPAAPRRTHAPLAAGRLAAILRRRMREHRPRAGLIALPSCSGSGGDWMYCTKYLRDRINLCPLLVSYAHG